MVSFTAGAKVVIDVVGDDVQFWVGQHVVVFSLEQSCACNDAGLDFDTGDAGNAGMQGAFPGENSGSDSHRELFGYIFQQELGQVGQQQLFDNPVGSAR